MLVVIESGDEDIIDMVETNSHRILVGYVHGKSPFGTSTPK
jgi:hypothetical protein